MVNEKEVEKDFCEVDKLELLEENPPTGVITSKRQFLYIVVVFMITALLWEFIVKITNYPKYILPPPSTIASALWSGLVTTRILWFHIYYTMVEVLFGFFLAAAFGLILGIWVALSPFAERIFYPYIVAMQTLPKVAVAPLFVIWLGFGMSSRIGIAATVAIFPVIVNTFVGIRNVESERIMFLRSLSATRWQIFMKVQLPSALPLIFAGLDLAIVFSVIGAIVGELVSGLHGLGSVIMQKNFALDTGSVFGILIILAVIGAGLHAMMSWVQKKVVFWGEEHRVISA